MKVVKAMEPGDPEAKIDEIDINIDDAGPEFKQIEKVNGEDQKEDEKQKEELRMNMDEYDDIFEKADKFFLGSNIIKEILFIVFGFTGGF